MFPLINLKFKEFLLFIKSTELFLLPLQLSLISTVPSVAEISLDFVTFYHLGSISKDNVVRFLNKPASFCKCALFEEPNNVCKTCSKL